MAAQYVAVPARLVIPIPDTVSDLAATALEPIAVALHAMDRIRPLAAEPLPTFVIGGGPLGLLQAQVMEHLGWPSTVVEPQARRRELGNELGLTVVAPEDADAGTPGSVGGPRLVIETSATAGGVELAERLATPGSLVAVVGRGPHSIPPPSVLLRELSILGIKGGPGVYPAAIDLVASGAVDPTAVVTHTFAWSEAATAFADTVGSPEEILRTALVGPW